MELLLELGLTVSLSLILTVFFVKLIAMQQPTTTTTTTTDNNKDEVAKLQWMPSQGDSIELEELKPERKSLVKFHIVGGTFGNQDCGELEQDDHTDRFDTNFDVDERSGNGGGERRSLEIEIESVDEDEDEDEDEGNGDGIESGGESEMSDWEKIERLDYEEIAAFGIGNGNDDSQVK